MSTQTKTYILAFLQSRTKLPMEMVEGVSNLQTTLFIETPTGRESIDMSECVKSMFSSASVVPISLTKVYQQVEKIDREAKEFLLGKWLSENHGA